MPESLCFGPAAPLLRALADCAERLYRFWWRTVKRKRDLTGTALDPRMVRINFTPMMPDTNSTVMTENLRANGPSLAWYVRIWQRVTVLLPKPTANQRLARPSKSNPAQRATE